ncbi:MAG TPA: hypothetical protein VNV63_02370 [Nitrospiria bacterium]|jgi:hypothetical protein|nr:hypothetical protein [Nitrospiria bacterium]
MTPLDTLMESLDKRYLGVMDNDPLLAAPEDIDVIIAYHRRNRANSEAGIKPKKEAGPPVDLVAMGLIKKTVAEPVRRRIV